MAISFLVNPIAPLRHFFYRHQRFSSLWQLSFVFLFLSDSSDLICYPFFLAEKNMLDIYGSRWSLLSLIGGSLLYFSCLAYNVFWLRKEFDQGDEPRAHPKELSSCFVSLFTRHFVVDFRRNHARTYFNKGIIGGWLRIIMFYSVYSWFFLDFM